MNKIERTEMSADWFERLMGFRERGYEETRRQMEVVGHRLRSRVNGESYGIGTPEHVSLQTLRERAQSGGGRPGRLKVSVVSGDVRKLHQCPEYTGALFQVASQFNLLEMVSPDVTPVCGVTGYQYDKTQGPACAMAAGAATIYRNYFAPIGNEMGQTSTRQFDGLADLGAALADGIGQPVESLWEMRNGYALCSRAGLDAIADYLETLTPAQFDELRGKLRIGVHSDVEVTDCEGPDRPIVSQAFCSALPVAYCDTHGESWNWEPFATLVLDSLYEATLLASVCNAQRGTSNQVLLTRVGGGVFGNDDEWIHRAMRRALNMVKGFDIDVRIVSYGTPSRQIVQLEDEFL